MNYQSKKPNKVIPAVKVMSTESPGTCRRILHIDIHMYIYLYYTCTALEQDTVEISSEMTIAATNLPGKVHVHVNAF